MRHLLYHCYPAGDWRRCLDQLRPRLPLFDGLRLLAVAADERSATAREVGDHLAAERVEVLPLENDPHLREMVSLPLLLERVRAESAGGHIFWGHAKGVRHTGSGAADVRRWHDVLLEANLDYWPLVEKLLSAHPVVGALKRVNVPFDAPCTSGWHYSGGMYWLDTAELFARPRWQKWCRTWHGSECYPGKVFRAEEGGCLFHEGGRELDLYQQDYWRETVEPSWAAWVEENRRWHAPGGAA